MLLVLVTAWCNGFGQVNDDAIRKFLDDHRNRWHDLNVPYEDGELLYNLIIKNHYTKALEIGTSTGHSTIWIAWALSKTGGKLITIEINEERHNEAVANLQQLGLLPYVDARLADAHSLVKQLNGPFDFVFSDADKGWYIRYFKDIDPKLAPGGCFTAHNVRNDYGGTREFLEYIQQQPGYSTTVQGSSSAGVSVSYKN